MFDPVAVLEHHKQAVPRYTSYPTAPRFRDGEGGLLFDQLIEQLEPTETVSVYIHIPFCDRLCWFCGCHTKHTLKYAPVRTYLDALHQELQLFSQRLSFRPRLGQLHLGGGSPSLLRPDDLDRLRQALERAFVFDNDTEISVELDPSDVREGSVEAFADFGLTRASVGVQDFAPEVQAAINRPQSFEITRNVVEELRAAGIRSINIDALYGLPLQTRSRLMKTVEQCISMQPDRVALFGYAHIPWLKKHQRMINGDDLPSANDRFYDAQAASVALQEAGYAAIGIDHFAKPDDGLARAARSGTLRRNFQGYTTDAHETLFGFGASSIGRLSDAYIQNTVATGEYQTQVKQGLLPKAKGMALSLEDQLRGHVIERLMCHFTFDFRDLELRSVKVAEEMMNEAHAFVAQDNFGLCSMEGTRLSINKDARAFTRIVAASLDVYFQPEELQYSKAV